MRKHLVLFLLLLFLPLGACEPFASPSTPGPGPVTSSPGPGPVTSSPGPGPVTSSPDPGPVTSAPGPGPVTSAPGPGPVTSAPGPGLVTPGTGCDKVAEVDRQVKELYNKQLEAIKAGRTEEAAQLNKAYAAAWQQLQYLRSICPHVPERR
ncbi:hypothetical protein POF51_07115 [Brevibacillus sp. AG]|uniref:hypothetical protein n=1 Tax=Brevibacillus sp. AG TaxID=3020891 RepID=UPI000852E968|nr:hypothetical protein [Brevibacillus sp. AG]MDC0760454.1 hypothetical protein [Brevibacillus sp. AG]